jgi:hypothetical protein
MENPVRPRFLSSARWGGPATRRGRGVTGTGRERGTGVRGPGVLVRSERQTSRTKASIMLGECVDPEGCRAHWPAPPSSGRFLCAKIHHKKILQVFYLGLRQNVMAECRQKPATVDLTEPVKVGMLGVMGGLCAPIARLRPWLRLRSVVEPGAIFPTLTSPSRACRPAWALG